MKIQFMMIALVAVTVMVIPSAFADIDKYDLNIVFGNDANPNGDRLITGALFYNDSNDIWSGEIIIEQKNGEKTFTISNVQIVNGELYINAVNGHLWKHIIVDISEDKDEFILTFGKIYTSVAASGKTIHVSPILGGTLSPTE